MSKGYTIFSAEMHVEKARLEDRAGNEINPISYNTGPLIGLSLWGAF